MKIGTFSMICMHLFWILLFNKTVSSAARLIIFFSNLLCFILNFYSLNYLTFNAIGFHSTWQCRMTQFEYNEFQTRHPRKIFHRIIFYSFLLTSATTWTHFKQNFIYRFWLIFEKFILCPLLLCVASPILNYINCSYLCYK